jgi:hypothetical protein
MSKLPDAYVKAPTSMKASTTTPAQPKPRTRRTRKASLISPEPVKNPRELILHLTEDEYQALEEARQKLNEGGTEVTLEQMIHRVFADWMMRARAVVQAPLAAVASATNADAASTEPAANTGSAASSAHRDADMIARLRAFVAAPLRMWRELASQVWRTSLLRRS